MASTPTPRTIVDGPPCASDDLAIDARLDEPPDPLIPDDKRRFAKILRHRLTQKNFFDLYKPTSQLEEKESPHVRGSPVRRYISYGTLVVHGVNVPVVVKCMSAASTTSTASTASTEAWDLERKAIESETHAYDCVVPNMIDNPFFVYAYAVHKTTIPSTPTTGLNLAAQLCSVKGLSPLCPGNEVTLVVMEGEKSPSLKSELEKYVVSDDSSSWSDDESRRLVAVAMQMIVAVESMRKAGIVHEDLHLSNVLLTEREFYFSPRDGSVAGESGPGRVKMDRMIRVFDWDRSRTVEQTRDKARDEAHDAVAVLKLLTWWFRCGLKNKAKGTLWDQVVDAFHRSTIKLRRHQPIKWLFATEISDYESSCVHSSPPWGLQYTAVPEGKAWTKDETRLIWERVRMLYALLDRTLVYDRTRGPFLGGEWVGDLSEPTWKAEGGHAVTGHGTYRGERKFVKMVCLSRANRQVEVVMNARIDAMVNSLRIDEDFRADYFLAAEVVRVDVRVDVGAGDSSSGVGLIVPNSVPEWARSWIAEYEKHATVDNPQYAFLFMRDVSAGVPLWRWWGSVSGNTFRDRSIMLAQIVTALEALANTGITHNDLHWGNIIVETIDPKDFQVIDLGGQKLQPSFRPVLFDWDRAVAEPVTGVNGREKNTHVDAFDRHYDLIGLYKNLTQKYRPDEQYFWRLLLHPSFEPTFDMFPSLALNHPHHANPCLSSTTDSRRRRYAAEYQFLRELKRTDETRPEDCQSTWSEVSRWNDPLLYKPSHADVVGRITYGLLPDSATSPPSASSSVSASVDHDTDTGADVLVKLAAHIEVEKQKADNAIGAAKYAAKCAANTIEKARFLIANSENTDETKMKRLADYVATLERTRSLPVENDTEDDTAADLDAACTLKKLPEDPVDIEAFLNEIQLAIALEEKTSKQATTDIMTVINSSHEMARAMTPVKTLFDALYVSVEV